MRLQRSFFSNDVQNDFFFNDKLFQSYLISLNLFRVTSFKELRSRTILPVLEPLHNVAPAKTTSGFTSVENPEPRVSGSN
jgi:hypothetical protein